MDGQDYRGSLPQLVWDNLVKSGRLRTIRTPKSVLGTPQFCDSLLCSLQRLPPEFPLGKALYHVFAHIVHKATVLRAKRVS